MTRCCCLINNKTPIRTITGSSVMVGNFKEKIVQARLKMHGIGLTVYKLLSLYPIRSTDTLTLHTHQRPSLDCCAGFCLHKLLKNYEYAR